MRASVLAAIVLLVGGGVVAGPAPHADAADLTGKVIVLDAGHGASADGPLTRQVPNGRGGTKDCQTTGTSTNDGLPEHTFTWDVASLIRSQLAQLGADVVMTRSDDTGPPRASIGEPRSPTLRIPTRSSAFTATVARRPGMGSTSTTRARR